jgi:hypothetical protein
MSTDRDRNDWAYRKAAEAVRSTGGVCICGRPIDPTLPRDQAASASADHVQPVAEGGELLGPLRNMHRVCNMRRRTKPVTPELMRYLAGLPLEWDPKPSHPRKHPPTHSQEW